MDELSFFKELSLNISSSLEPAKAWSRTFHFLAQEFPIDAISVHNFKPQINSLHLGFLVLPDRYLELDTLIPLRKNEVLGAVERESSGEIINIYCPEQPVGERIVNGIGNYLPSKVDRSLLVIILKTEEEVIGHLCLIGNNSNCFSQEHEAKLKLIQAPISLALMNMYRHAQTEELKTRLDAERLQLAGEVSLLRDSSIIGADSGLRETMKMVEQLAGKETPTLILGETGVGKELIADAIQRSSPRKDNPYIKINCGAIPESLIDSELFGHHKGAFTGAINNKIGRFEQADGGTLFLDEVGELPLQAQVRLLRVLQSGTLERVGGESTIHVDVRIIAATNRPLEQMQQSGSFRQDLFYRLNVFPIHIPPLRERPQDIPLMIHYFMRGHAKRMKLSKTLRIAIASLAKLNSYSWPGNIRELKNLVERALTIDPNRDLDLAPFLPDEQPQPSPQKAQDDSLSELVSQQLDRLLKERNITGPNIASSEADEPSQTLNAVMSAHISKILKQCNGKINGPGGAAEKLDIDPSTLRKRMTKLDISFGHRKK
jgi:transcriptional regulator with GAF, ATPase, and Fis domain